MHGSKGTGQLATELCEHLGFERYDAMDAWILGIVDSWLGTNNWQYIAHAINLIYRIQLCKMSESEAEVQ